MTRRPSSKGNGFAHGGHCALLIAPPLIFLYFCFFVSVLVTAGSLRWYIKPIEVSEVNEFLHNATSVRAVTGMFAVSSSSITTMEENTRR